SAPAIVHANGGPWHVIDEIVTNGVPLAEREKDAGDLLAEVSAVVDQVIGDQVFPRNWPACSLNLRAGSNQADCAIARFGNSVTVDSVVEIILIEKNGVATYCIEETPLNRTVLGSFQENSPLAVDRPISARGRFVTFQKCAFGM